MGNHFKYLILTVLFPVLIACSGKKLNKEVKNSDKIKLEEITSRINPEDGWSDIFLKITDDKKTDSSHIYTLKGIYKTKKVGLQIEVSSKIGAGIGNGNINGETGFVTDAVQFYSTGNESDELIKALAELYDNPTNKGFTKRKISTTVFSLNEKNVNLDKEDYYKLKVFFEEENGNLYAEVFLNINTKDLEIEINEKDEEYRETIINILTR